MINSRVYTIVQIIALLLCWQFATAKEKDLPKPLKVGFSLSVGKVTTEKMREARAAGIHYIELSMSDFVDKEGLLKVGDAEILERVKKAKMVADEAGVEVWSIHMPFSQHIDLSLTDEAKRRKIVALHKVLLEFVTVLKPKIILFHPSWYLNHNERELRKQQLIKSVNELNIAVHKMKATMVIENMLGYELVLNEKFERPLCRTVEETVEVMGRLPDNVFSAVDMNHIKDPEFLIRAMGKRLKSVHVADGTGKQENHYLPCSGKGGNNWTEILQALNDVGYNGAFIYESSFKDLKSLKSCYETLYENAFIKDQFSDSLLSTKIFPLLSMTKHSPEVALTLKREKMLSDMQVKQAERISEAFKTCENTNKCYPAALNWTNQEIKEAGDVLVKLYVKHAAIKAMVSDLRERGSYATLEDQPDTAYLRSAFVRDARGLNHIFSVYIGGKPPRYAKIDSISFRPGDIGYKERIRDVLDEAIGSGTFLSLPLHAAIRILKINGRDEAVRYEPSNEGMNSAPYRRINCVKWSEYPYSVILVPGLGPEAPNVKLDPNGAKRCEAAVEQYRKGLAPFIVVSGGNVHPFRTPYNEAVEMKNYLVEKLGIPEDVVMIEPHARHTTTNIRNTSRMIYRFGIPEQKPVLIVTDVSQSKYIVERMEKTAVRDLGYIPYKDLRKLTEEHTVFYPVHTSLNVDSIDPLDP